MKELKDCFQDDYALHFRFKECVNIRPLINHCQN